MPSSDPEERVSLFHVLDHLHTERTAFFASAAGNAIGRVRVQGLIMLADGRRHFAQAPGQVIILMHRGNVDF